MAISEKELIAALAETGREVSPRVVGEWRQCGLLPDLLTRSQGLRKGKSCFWADDAVFDRAALLHDLLRSRTEKHEAYCLLWLCGFDVPMAQLRRAWLHRRHDGKGWKVGTPASVTPTNRTASLTRRETTRKVVAAKPFSHHLLQAALSACASLMKDNETEIDALISAFTALFGEGSRCELSLAAVGMTQGQIAALLKAAWSALKSSDLVSSSSDDELREAQRFAAMALRTLHRSAMDRMNGYRSRANAREWPVEEAKAFGAPLFFFVLAILRSEQHEILELVHAELVRALGADAFPTGNESKIPTLGQLPRLRALT